ncbi:restriction endonuclease subunit S [Lactococcus petauri]|uniref:restriction endonuclease subunit S n=1 Tax=Lactococcus petauri TaxID=1940789 RepID=UPI0035E1CD49
MTENQDNNSYFSSDSTVKFDGSLLNLIQGAEVEYNTLGEVAEIWDGTHQTPKYIDSGIPFVSVENIKNLKATTKYISAEDFKKYKAKPQKGDILMSRIGTIGEVAVVTDDEPLTQRVTLCVIPENHSPSAGRRWEKLQRLLLVEIYLKTIVKVKQSLVQNFLIRFIQMVREFRACMALLTIFALIVKQSQFLREEHWVGIQ